MRRSMSSPVLLLIVLVGAGMPALASEQAGVSAAVRGDVALNRPQIAVGHQVVGGEPILLEDAIRSGPRSGMQVLLLDQTVFTIGPESELVIDEFVYDPKTNVGKLSAEVTKGVFRFVTGKIAHEDPKDMNVKLPAGTLGVRGTMVAGRVDETKKSSQLVLLGEGQDNDTGAPASAFVACNAGECVRVSRPGYGTNIDGPDSPPTPPYLVPPLDIDRLTRDVSDPQGWTETATSGDGKNTDVAAGGNGAEDDDTRSAGEASGADTASGRKAASAADRRLDRVDLLDEATAAAAQDALERENLTTCADLSCGSVIESPLPPSFSDITTYDQLAALAALGQQEALYTQSGISLINTDGRTEGSYDFSLQVLLGDRSGTLTISNINSNPNSGLLGLRGESFESVTSFADVPTNQNIPVAFVATGSGLGFDNSGACTDGCSAVASAIIVNANGGIATAVQQAVVITAPTPTGGPVVGAVTANPEALIPRSSP